ncbi:archaeosortase/exosortase family protein [uncultured Methanomethylovorans sp.]|uniref:archaeosortase/exosortase family protein n=1 Tax=uncultured Methanomethylovorans sp. TaxID=183759 RepID=UPI002AA72F2C|nr:archaeosortase/exosortase family protein [uncultured Methanomethylovorans sp.]
MNPKMKNKLLIWLAISIAITVLRLSFSQHDIVLAEPFTAHPFVILILCIVFGWLKKDAILSQMNEERMLADSSYVAVGVFIAAVALLMPLSEDLVFVIFNILLLCLGLFVIFFADAAYLPSLLLFVYGFSISFPKIINEYFGTQYALITTNIVSHVAALFYPVAFEGQVLSVTNPEGVKDLLYIDVGCSGSASIAIFLTVFALMLIDIKPRKDSILPLFLFGILGTSVQNILRLVLLIAADYHFGSAVMWQVHDYAGYVLFPTWFAIFVYVYLKVGMEKTHITAVDEKEDKNISIMN